MIGPGVNIVSTAVMHGHRREAPPEIVDVRIAPDPLYPGDVPMAWVSRRGHPAPEVQYRWSLNGELVHGQIGQSYTAPIAVGDVLIVEARALDNGVGPTTAWVASAPLTVQQAMEAPSVTAAGAVSGRVVTVTPTATGVPAPALAIAMTLDGAAVTPAGSGPWSYTVPSSEDAQTVAWTVTATNAAGTATASGSVTVAADINAPPPDPDPDPDPIIPDGWEIEGLQFIVAMPPAPGTLITSAAYITGVDP